MQNDTLAPLAAGLQQSLGLPYESYSLAYTPDIILQQYNSDTTRLTEAMLEAGGYLDLEGDGHYWLPSGTVLYSATPEADFYSPLAYSDPWGNGTLVTYANNYYLLPESITDAKGNVTSVEDYDWRLLQPLKLKDVNDNISEVLYDALGMPVAMALKGKDNPLAPEGDTLSGLLPDDPDDLILQAAFWTDPESAATDLLQGATWRCVYDLAAQPARVGMIARTRHAVAPGPVETLIRLSYSDGMGRVLMHKAQCAPTLENGSKQWIGSGRTVYNNKGSVVMQYEPYFSITHNCDTAEQAAQQGVSPKLYYDPLNRNYRTDLPDGTFTKTEWTAWEQEVWDNNDTVLESAWYAARINDTAHPEAQQAAQKAAAHANTPTLIHTDTLGRGFYTIQLLVAAVAEPVEAVDPDDAIHSYENLDIQGNRLSVVDGRGLTPLIYSYNMLQAPCLQDSLDSGTQRTVLDVAGQPLYSWDAEDRRTEIVYDALMRPLQKITALYNATNDDWEGDKVLEVYAYGEGQASDKAYNLRGQLYQHKDGAGQQQVNAYDFKGNPLSTGQQLLANATLTDVDWAASPVLSTEVFTSTTNYDALSRPVTATDPGANVHAFSYDKGGLLKTVQLNSATYVQDIHYDAKGQRQAIWYGNGTKTGYTYDSETFRLTRLLTVNVDSLSPHYNEILQDLNYWYDPVSNITTIKDDAQQTLFFNNSVIRPDQEFTYDAIYRLTEAKGRELIGTASFGAADNWNDAPWMTQAQPGDGAAVQNYTQLYIYDKAGNITELQHVADTGGYTRTYNIAAANNRMMGTQVGTETYNYSYEVRRGNMTAMPHLSSMVWNRNNELCQIVSGSNAVYYQYNSGQRIRKYVNKVTFAEERIYLGNYELYRKYDNNGDIDVERSTVHVSDDTGRIAMLEVLNTDYNSDGAEDELARYIYSNHLQSASLELDEAAEIISYEEYHPYGTTAYQASNPAINAIAKRYRYTGKERDEESGLYYHGARYYIPWLCRWTACDPLESKYAGMSPYNYSFNNPVVWNDSTGMEPDDPQQLKTGTTSGFMELEAGIPANFSIPEVEISASRIKKEDQGFSFKNSPYAMLRPIEAGFISGIGEFFHDTGYGIGEIMRHPATSMEETVKSLTYLTALGVGGTQLASELEGGTEYFTALQLSLSSSLDNFIEGDAYTKANYIGYGTAFVGSLFVGAGEVRSIATAGKLSKAVNTIGKVDEISSISSGLTLGKSTELTISAKRGTVGFRYMTEGELNAIRSGPGKGFLRGGRPGETFFTKDVYKSAAKASQRLGLENIPTLRVEFEILNTPTLMRNGTKVQALPGLSGRGAEFMTTDPVNVNLINWQPLR